ncbi:MAG TPA: urate hydroxylase PuuD, partial [Polyangiaceae bacterium]
MLEESVRELLDVLLRWVHLVAGIMWVGNSLLFNWLDRNLIRDAGAGERHLGRIWLLHSGGFYDVEKKFLAPSEMPRVLHWFKWQSYTTWMSGIALLTLLYWTGGASLMIDPGVARLGPGQAAAIGVGVVVGGWIVYDGVWRLLARHEGAAIALSLALVAAVIWTLTHVLSGRAAFIHVGAMLGTCMAGNVAMHIVPSQRQLVAATEAGRAQDPRVSDHAKQRSIHNNYMTFPLLFTMLSNHFSLIYGSRASWLLLGILFVGGALVRHWMNVRFTFRAWLPALALTVCACVGAVL